MVLAKCIILVYHISNLGGSIDLCSNNAGNIDAITGYFDCKRQNTQLARARMCKLDEKEVCWTQDWY